MHPILRLGSLAAIVLGAMLSGAAVAATIPPTDATAFVSSAAQAGLMEVASARQALDVSKNEAVRTFASRMIADHEKAQAELRQIATSKQIPFPQALDGSHAKTVDSQ